MSEKRICPKCECAFSYPHFPLLECPKCGHNHQPERHYKAVPSKQTMLDALEACKAKGLTDEEYEKARETIEEKYTGEDKLLNERRRLVK
jgi:hypothetical protein